MIFQLTSIMRRNRVCMALHLIIVSDSCACRMMTLIQVWISLITSQQVHSKVITINTTSGSNNTTCCIVCVLHYLLLYMTSSTVINITSESVILEDSIVIWIQYFLATVWLHCSTMDCPVYWRKIIQLKSVCSIIMTALL